MDSMVWWTSFGWPVDPDVGMNMAFFKDVQFLMMVSYCFMYDFGHALSMTKNDFSAYMQARI